MAEAYSVGGGGLAISGCTLTGNSTFDEIPGDDDQGDGRGHSYHRVWQPNDDQQ